MHYKGKTRKLLIQIFTTRCHSHFDAAMLYISIHADIDEWVHTEWNIGRLRKINNYLNDLEGLS